MSTPHKCPVCDGTGKVRHPDANQWEQLPVYATCHACDGSGIVWEPGGKTFLSRPDSWPTITPLAGDAI